MSNESRGCLGSVYKITADFLGERGLLDEVRSKISPESRAMVEKPPFAFAWRDSAALEEIERVLYARSPELCVDLGHAAGRQLSQSIVAPVLKMALSLFGTTPASLFGNLDRFFSMVVRGFSFQYQSAAPKDGVVRAQIEGAGVHPSLFQQLRGNLKTIFDLCSVAGTVGAAQVVRNDESGAEVLLPVRWQ